MDVDTVTKKLTENTLIKCLPIWNANARENYKKIKKDFHSATELYWYMDEKEVLIVDQGISLHNHMFDLPDLLTFATAQAGIRLRKYNQRLDYILVLDLQDTIEDLYPELDQRDVKFILPIWTNPENIDYLGTKNIFWFIPSISQTIKNNVSKKWFKKFKSRLPIILTSGHSGGALIYLIDYLSKNIKMNIVGYDYNGIYLDYPTQKTNQMVDDVYINSLLSGMFELEITNISHYRGKELS